MYFFLASFGTHKNGHTLDLIDPLFPVIIFSVLVEHFLMIPAQWLQFTLNVHAPCMPLLSHRGNCFKIIAIMQQSSNLWSICNRNKRIRGKNIFFYFVGNSLYHNIPVGQRIEIQGSRIIRCHKLSPNVPLRKTMIYAKIFYPGSKSLIQP